MQGEQRGNATLLKWRKETNTTTAAVEEEEETKVEVNDSTANATMNPITNGNVQPIQFQLYS
jgi:hypothetical protein